MNHTGIEETTPVTTTNELTREQQISAEYALVYFSNLENPHGLGIVSVDLIKDALMHAARGDAESLEDALKRMKPLMSSWSLQAFLLYRLLFSPLGC